MIIKAIFSRFFLHLVAFLVLIHAAKTQPLDSTFRYEPDWESIREGYEVPDWFRDAKFGIFLHWGPYAVPAKGSEKYPKYMYYENHKSLEGLDYHAYHRDTYGDHAQFGYKDFIPMFKAENFDPEEWVDLFKKTGAKYIVPVAEHHDAFAMYNSKFTRWNVVNMGPKNDVMAMLARASRKEGLKFGMSSHLANWRNYYWKKPHFDNSNPDYADLYWKPTKKGELPSQEFLDIWWNRTTDIIDQYEPDLLWFDFGLDKPGFNSVYKEILAYYYNKGLEWDKGVVFQNKNMFQESFPNDLIVLDIERGRMDSTSVLPWQTDTSVGKISWGYIDDEVYKSANYLLDELIDIVSKNGCLLLNVGPKADGTIPDEARHILVEMGEWLAVNGEAIYDTRPWHIYGEGPTKVNKGHHSESENKDSTSEDIRFTTNGDMLYATALDWSEEGKFIIKSLSSDNPYESRRVRSVETISGTNRVKWTQTKDGLVIKVKGGQPNEIAVAFRIIFKS
ncbi:MAG: alpha-L-fucosidase [Cyclobacteriaceae bacterium]